MLAGGDLIQSNPFKSARIPKHKPKYVREREIEQEKRIRAALSGIRATYASKNPVNVLLHGSAASSKAGSSYSTTLS